MKRNISKFLLGAIIGLCAISGVKHNVMEAYYTYEVGSKFVVAENIDKDESFWIELASR